MSFPRYPAYEDSGVAWLGKVPAHWKVTPLKSEVSLRSGGTPSKANLDYWDGEIPWASSKDIKVEALTDTEDHITHRAVDDGAAELVPTGSVLIVVRGMILAHTFPVAITAVPTAINQDLKALSPSYRLAADFLAWLLRGSSRETLGRIDEAGHGTKVLRIEAWTSMPLPIPPLIEQSAITAFLNRETAKIDALVAEQRRLMDLLKEKRQAVISHAVTKGLNPDAPMKPSGVEWIGDVPAHWEVNALKRVAEVRTGIAKGKDNSNRATIVVPYLRVANVQDGFLDLDVVSTIEIPATDLDRYSLRPGDVLMNEGGDFDKLGRGHVWDGQIEPCITQNHVFAVRPRFIASVWLNALTGSDYAQYYFMTRSKQSTNLASISSTNLMELPVLLPPDGEQREILAFVSEQRRRFDALSYQASRAIELLLERRTALISAAVTGQIDVRNFTASSAA